MSDKKTPTAAAETVADIAADTSEVKTPAETEKAPENAKTDTLTLERVLQIEHPNIKGKDVVAVQKALIAKGYHVGKDGANGIYNPDTVKAVRVLQATTGRPVTGKVDKHTIEALGGKWTA
jgi:peptidoglycan hydrolase-like protein with peptidoglycan-binding domain